MSAEPQTCFVVLVCAVCERQVGRDDAHAENCPARREKWPLRKLVPVIRTPYPAADYVAVKRDEYERLTARLAALAPNGGRAPK